MSKNYASHSCVSRVKSPMFIRFATYPDVSYRAHESGGSRLFQTLYRIVIKSLILSGKSTIHVSNLVRSEMSLQVPG